ncbi:hypothetical protein SAMN04489740_3997 [Arthrobacter alpinus]|uniref:TrbL/VirB6 plasmid conjugal transfer protein n=2 Tax=Arthrobacter alpinus TaxID=656366 RepID=A0A1H5P962_9MICC|nr:hypothetical protein SAMN04489740_3997 [Arthrobacter alpinus]
MDMSAMVALRGVAPASLMEDLAVNAVAGIMKGIIGGMASGVWDMISGAYANTGITDSSWDIVGGTSGGGGYVGTWLLVMAPILVAVVAVQVTISVFKRSGAGVVRAGVGAVVGIPASLIVVWFVEKLSFAFEGVTQYFLGSLGAKGGMAPFMKIFGYLPVEGSSPMEFTVDPDTWLWKSGFNGATSTWISALLIMAIAWVFSLILSAMMIFRDLGILILAAAAPVAVMMMPLEVTKAWIGKWGSLVAGLLMAKPLSAFVLVLSVSLFTSSPDVSQTIAGLLGMIMASAMPLVVIKFFTFTPTGAIGDVDSGSKQASQGTGRAASSVARFGSRIVRRGR